MGTNETEGYPQNVFEPGFILPMRAGVNGKDKTLRLRGTDKEIQEKILGLRDSPRWRFTNGKGGQRP